LKRDFATTFLTEGVVVFCYLLAFRLVAEKLGASGFGEYALARRTLAVLIPLGALSLDIAVARYVAYAMAERSDWWKRYAPAAVAMVVGASVVVSAVLLVWSGAFAQLFFGSSRYSNLITPMPLLVLGGGLHGIAYGYLRGRSRIQRANLLLIINQALIPVAAILLSGGSVARILLLMGGGWNAVSLVFLALAPLSFSGLPQRVAELARFGVPRVPGDLLRLGLFSLPGVLVAHVADIATAGSVAFGVAAVGMFGTALSPIGFVMLPVAARMMAAGEIPELRRRVIVITSLTSAALVVGIAVVEFFAPQIVAVYLGPGFAGTVGAVRVIAPAALPWGIYMSLASVVDAHHVRPVNARNMAVAFAVFVLAAGGVLLFHATPLAVTAAFVVSLYVLGALTLFEVHSITNRPEMPASLVPRAEVPL
jgi:O-antigen/teichoic acid export membrane protein